MWRSCKNTFNSTIAYAFKLIGGAILWCFKEQNLISLSSIESEHKTLSFGAQEDVWLWQLLHKINPVTVTMTPTLLYCEDIKLTSTLPTPNSLSDFTLVHCDNESAMKLAKNPIFHSKSRHIGIQRHFIREWVALKEIKVRFLSTKLQLANMFIKVLPRLKLN